MPRSATPGRRLWGIGARRNSTRPAIAPLRAAPALGAPAVARHRMPATRAATSERELTISEPVQELGRQRRERPYAAAVARIVLHRQPSLQVALQSVPAPHLPACHRRFPGRGARRPRDRVEPEVIETR